MLKIDDEARITAGPRKGQTGIIKLLALNGAFLKMKDGKFHTVRNKHIELIIKSPK